MAFKCPQCGKWVQSKKHAHICVDRPARQCLVCGGEYIPVRNNQECCSRECRKKRDNMKAAKRRIAFQNKMKAEPEERVCPICGEAFIPKVANQICCGKADCRKKRHSDTERARFGLPALDAFPASFSMPDPYEGMLLYFDGLHPARRHMPGRAADPVLGF